MKLQRRKKTALQRYTKALAQIRQAYQLIAPEHMEASYVDIALAQLKVAYENIEYFRRTILKSTAKPSNSKAARQLLTIGNSFPGDGETCSSPPARLESQAITVETVQEGSAYAP